jgi:hypothetical protein
MFSRLFRKTLPLETQIQGLKELGITFNLPDEELIGKLKEQFDPQAYANDPYTLLISTAGTDLLDEDGNVLRMSDDILSFDIECVEDEQVYTHIVEQFMRLTKGECRISELDSNVDFNEEAARLSFSHEGRRHELEVTFEDDWFDVSVLERIAEIVRKPGKDFVYFKDGQTLTILYCTPEALEKLNRAANRKFRVMA